VPAGGAETARKMGPEDELGLPDKDVPQDELGAKDVISAIEELALQDEG